MMDSLLGWLDVLSWAAFPVVGLALLWEERQTLKGEGRMRR